MIPQHVRFNSDTSPVAEFIFPNRISYYGLPALFVFYDASAHWIQIITMLLHFPPNIKLTSFKLAAFQFKWSAETLVCGFVPPPPNGSGVFIYLFSVLFLD